MRHLLLFLLLLALGCGTRSPLSPFAQDAPVRPPDAGSPVDPDDAGTPADAAIDVDAGPIDAGPVDAGPAVCPSPRTVAPREASVPVDIIWAVDGSISMTNKVTRLRTHIDRFWRRLDETGVDARVIIIAREGQIPPPESGFARRYFGITDRVRRDTMLKVLTHYPTYEPFLRPGSVVHVVLASDDESRVIEADAFDAEFRALLGRDYMAHAIASEYFPPTITNPRGACYSENIAAIRPGLEYLALTELTGGSFFSICADDWLDLVELLSERVAIRIPLPCALSLPQPPPDGRDYDPRTFTVRATAAGRAEELPRALDAGCDEGWRFVERADRIELCASTCDRLDAVDARVTVDVCPR